MSQSPMFEQLKQAPIGIVEITSKIDGLRRLNSYEQGHTYPVVITVAQDIDELLAPWKQDAMRQSAQTLVITMFVILMGAFVWRATRTLTSNSIKLRETNARFDAALANMPSGLTMFDASGGRTVWNEKYLKLYELPSDVVRSDASLESIVEYRRQASQLDIDVVAHIGDFRQSLIDTGSSTSTSRLDNGKTVSLTSVAIAGGGWVSMHEDITERVCRRGETFQSGDGARMHQHEV